VAPNTVLEEALRTRPRTMEELREIRGIGPAFCERHGESLLAALARMNADETTLRQQGTVAALA
jgi:hypothetical protein